MNAFNKLIKYLGAGGAVALILIAILLIFVVGPFMLIWGLNLMGVSIAYSIKTFFGASLVILALKATNTKGSKE
jgi:hypothetical protein